MFPLVSLFYRFMNIELKLNSFEVGSSMFVLLNVKEFQSLMIINKNQDTTKVVNSNMFDIWNFSKLCASVPLRLCNYSIRVAASRPPN